MDRAVAVPVILAARVVPVVVAREHDEVDVGVHRWLPEPEQEYRKEHNTAREHSDRAEGERGDEPDEQEVAGKRFRVDRPNFHAGE